MYFNTRSIVITHVISAHVIFLVIVLQADQHQERFTDASPTPAENQTALTTVTQPSKLISTDCIQINLANWR